MPELADLIQSLWEQGNMSTQRNLQQIAVTAKGYLELFANLPEPKPGEHALASSDEWRLRADTARGMLADDDYPASSLLGTVLVYEENVNFLRDMRRRNAERK